MKKAFEIWIDDKDDFIGICGTFITSRKGDGNKSVNCCNFNEKDLKGKSGYYFQHNGVGEWLVKPDENNILIDEDNGEKQTYVRMTNYQKFKEIKDKFDRSIYDVFGVVPYISIDGCQVFKNTDICNSGLCTDCPVEHWMNEEYNKRKKLSREWD